MNRREFLALGGGALVATAGNTLSGLPLAPEATLIPYKRRSGKPNILLLMADQLRADCGGGNPAVHTPNLDWLARHGVRFKNAYSSTPTCPPARAALMSGLGPWRHGMLGYTNMASRPFPVEKARELAKAGYYTTSIGKNHYYPLRNAHGYHQMVTDEPCTYWFHHQTPGHEASPEERCDYEAWFWSQMPLSDPHATGLSWNDYRAAPFVYPDAMHPTHWTGETAVRFLQHYDRSEPFFLKVSFTRPHSPYDPPKRFLKHYEGVQIPSAFVSRWADRYEPRSDKSYEIWHGKLSDKQIRSSRQGYYGSVSFVDEQLGRIFEVLERRGMLEDTFVVFVADHGDMLGDHNLWRKSYAYESSAHIPMMLRAPSGLGVGTPGQIVENPVELRDVLPTLLDAAGAPIPDSLEGRSLLELIKTKGAYWRSDIDLEHNICYSPANHWNALTDGRWKYIFHARDGEEQLFELKTDPHELTDLAGISAYSTDLRFWRGRLTDHLAERGDRWVRNGKLSLRPEGTMLSPHFPGYATSSS